MKMPTNPHITYTSPKGRPFRVSAVSKVEDSEKWINGSYRYHTKVLIKFLDDDSWAKIIFGYSGEFISINKC